MSNKLEQYMDVKDLLNQSKNAAKWMQWWLNNNECDCEMYHVCGKDERKKELENLTYIIQKVEQNYFV